MAFLLPILEGVGTGLLGNAIGGAVGGGIAGGAENGAMNALNSQDESFQLGMYASEVQNQEQMQMQSEVFDQMMNERSDSLRPSAAYSALETLKEMARQQQTAGTTPPESGDSSDSIKFTASPYLGRNRR
jgi:hypothetical protein